VSAAFRLAVEAGDMDAAIACLAPDVTFNSPVAHTPFEGAETVGAVLRAVSETFEDFEYTDELADGDTHALVFRARVGDKRLEGLDLLRMNEDGLIENLTVMVRPASGLMALGAAMGPKVQHLSK
jgi:limonene-1,2-epoxide hydrolase